MKMTPGKLAGMKAVSDGRGVIAAAAMDQRGSLQKALAKEKGGDVSDTMMREFKTAVTGVLTGHASAILLDPQWGLEASRQRAKGAGLLLSYEASGYDNTQLGRLPGLLPGWSMRRLKEQGANCIKILLYYTPFETADVNEQKDHQQKRRDEVDRSCGLMAAEPRRQPREYRRDGRRHRQAGPDGYRQQDEDDPGVGQALDDVVDVFAQAGRSQMVCERA